MDAQLTITTLGELVIRQKGEVITTISSRKAEALLVYLAVEKGKTIRRERLYTLLWPGMPEKSARHNLRQVLYALQHTFDIMASGNSYESVSLLLADRQSVKLNPAVVVEVDVQQLENLHISTQTHDHLNLGSCEVCLQSLERAIELYGGEFLRDFYLEDSNEFEDWTITTREAIKRKVMDALQIMTDISLNKNDYEPARLYVERQLTLNELNESAHRRLMEILAKSGHRAAALRQYRACEQILKEELGVAPSAMTTSLFEQIRNENLPSFQMEPSATHSQPWKHHNLPQQLTSFIGREAEITGIMDLFKTHRLVTLTGSGGTGKTRLSLEVAADMLEHFPDGVWLAELAPLVDPNLVVETVAKSLGTQLASSPQALSFLEDYLRDKNILLLLDNCEHLIQACAHLANALLHTCPSLVILASSREALGIEGEFVYQVPPLSFPKIDEFPSIAEDSYLQKLEQFAAIRLFVERARSILPDFQINRENAPALAQICHHLDGIPLAIELAAARLRLLDIEEIARRLDDRFHLLIGGSRAVLPRYQTLRASLDWSYELLSAPERTLLQRLSTFAGGWFLEAAENVGCGEGIDSCDVLDLLGGLVNKSLVLVQAHLGSGTRYNMLETIRQYASQKLEESGQARLARHRHLHYYLELAEKTGKKLRGSGQTQSLDLLETELDNIRLALDWSLKSADQPNANLELGMRIASAMRWFWHARGRHEEALQWLERLLAADAEKRKQISPDHEKLLPPDNTKVRAWALLVAGCEAIESRAGDRNKIAQFLEESRDLFLDLGSEGRLGYADVLCISSEAVYDYETRKKLVEESLNIFKEEGDHFGMGQCYANLGEAASLILNYEEAKEYIENQRECFKSIDDQDGVGYAYCLLGMVEFDMGDPEKSRQFLEQSRRILSEIHNEFFQDPTIYLGILDWVDGDYAQAALKFHGVLATGKRLGSASLICSALIHLGLLALSQGDYHGAEDYFEQNLKFQRQKGYQLFVAFSLSRLGDLAWDEGDSNRAVIKYLEAREIYREVGNQYWESIILTRLARCAYDLGDLQKARSNLVDYLEKTIYRNLLECVLIFEIFAYLELTLNNYKKSALLLGYTHDVYSRNQRRFPPRARAMRELAIATLHQALGEEAFSAAWEEGKKMTLELVTDVALGETV